MNKTSLDLNDLANAPGIEIGNPLLSTSLQWKVRHFAELASNSGLYVAD
jgi:hypothetical protein